MKPVNRDGYPTSLPPLSYPTLPPRRGAVQLLAAAVIHLVRKMAMHSARQRQYERLLTMPDHLLRDIGLTRDDVLRAKAKPLKMDDLWESIR